MQHFIEQLAKVYPLGNWKLAGNLSTGFVNENYKIETALGPFLLRIYLKQPLDAIQSEMDLFAALREIEFPTAFPISKSDGSFICPTERGYVVLFQFLSGRTPDVNFETAFQIGTAIGKLSQLENRWHSKTNQLEIAWCEATLSKFPKSLTQSQLFLGFKHYTGILKDVAQVDLPSGVIHSDVFPDNTIFQDDQLIGIIDFEAFCHDALLYDLAMSINGFGFINNRLAESPLEGICAGYSMQRKLTELELRLLPRYIQLTALVMSCWHINNGLVDSQIDRSIARAEELIRRVIQLEGQLERIGERVATKM